MSKIAKGKILILTSGEYSDFGVTDIVEALKDLDLRTLETEFRESNVPEDVYGQRHSYYQFLKWLRDGGYVRESDQAIEIHLGEYGRLGIAHFEP